MHEHDVVRRAGHEGAANLAALAGLAGLLEEVAEDEPGREQHGASIVAAARLHVSAGADDGLGVHLRVLGHDELVEGLVLGLRLPDERGFNTVHADARHAEESNQYVFHVSG